VDGVMTPAPETVTADCVLEDAAARLFHLRIGCLPVVQPSLAGPRLVGLVTETDLLRAAYDSSWTWSGAV
jgi:CBS domain-containing protein